MKATKPGETPIDQISDSLALEMLKEQSEIIKLILELRDRFDNFKEPKVQKWVSRATITNDFDISYDQIKRHIKEGTFKLGTHYIDNGSKDSSIPDYRFNPKKVAEALAVPREKRK